MVLLAGVLVLIAAVPPRVWRLATNPPSLAADELAMVVEPHPPLYGLMVLPLALAGHRDALGIRLPAVMLGLAGLVLLWPLGDRLLQHQWAGVAAMGIMAATPWHIHDSRIGWTSALAIPMLLVALLLWIAAIRRRSALLLAAAAGVLASTVYGYRVFDWMAPLWLVVLLVLYRRTLTPRRAAVAVAVFALVYLPSICVHLREPLADHRARQALHVQTLGAFSGRYLTHFSPGFFFATGDSTARHHAPGTGQLAWWMAPLLVGGGLALARRTDLTHRGLLGAWLLIYPLGGSVITAQTPDSARTLLGLPALCLLAGLGLVTLAGWINRQSGRFMLGVLAGSVLAVAIVAEGGQFAQAEFVRYPVESSHWWDYGQAEIFETLWTTHTRYDRVCLWTVTRGQEPIYRAFYLQEFPLPVEMHVDTPGDNPADNSACRRPGTLVAMAAGRLLPPGAAVERVIRNPFDERIYTVHGIPR